MREAYRDGDVVAGINEALGSEYPSGFLIRCRPIIGCPNHLAEHTLFDFNYPARLDVEHRACCKGQGQVRVQYKPDTITCFRRIKQKGFKRRIERVAPIGFRAYLALEEMRHEVQHPGAAIFQVVTRMLERLDAEHHGPRFGALRQKPFLIAGLTKGGGVKLDPSLSHPVKDYVIVDK